eukprot:3050685-Alexandrium_andersonii.AAC.1
MEAPRAPWATTVRGSSGVAATSPQRAVETAAAAPPPRGGRGARAVVRAAPTFRTRRAAERPMSQ